MPREMGSNPYSEDVYQGRPWFSCYLSRIVLGSHFYFDEMAAGDTTVGSTPKYRAAPRLGLECKKVIPVSTGVGDAIRVPAIRT
jgi:hypothetical protein